MAKERKITIRGQTWRLRFSKTLKKHYGICYGSRRLIVLAEGMSRAKTLEVLVHESLHAAYPDLDEQPVDETARDIATAILSEPRLWPASEK